MNNAYKLHKVLQLGARDTSSNGIKNFINKHPHATPDMVMDKARHIEPAIDEFASTSFKNKYYSSIAKINNRANKAIDKNKYRIKNNGMYNLFQKLDNKYIKPNLSHSFSRSSINGAIAEPVKHAKFNINRTSGRIKRIKRGRNNSLTR